MSPDEHYIIVSEARKILNISWRRITALTTNGTLPKIDSPDDKRLKLIPMSAIHAYQESHKNRPRAKPRTRKAPAS